MSHKLKVPQYSDRKSLVDERWQIKRAFCPQWLFNRLTFTPLHWLVARDVRFDDFELGGNE